MKIQYFATTNDDKLREVNHILGYDLEKVHLELVEPQTLDVEEVVRAKALEAYQKVGSPVLVEDSAWYFDAWNGLPGPLVKFFFHQVGCEGILRMLQVEENRRTLAKAAVAYHDGKEVHVFVGELPGIVTKEARGTTGFGFDPIFIPDGHIKTFAEMSAAEKNSLSMRALAVQQLKTFLESQE